MIKSKRPVAVPVSNDCHGSWSFPPASCMLTTHKITNRYHKSTNLGRVVINFIGKEWTGR